MSAKKVAVIVGSLRKESFNRKVANELIRLAPRTSQFHHVDIGQLPLYSEDLENANPPQQWTTFRKQMQPFDAVLFATAEYNRSMPGCLKNALDVGSRPYGKSVWDNKPCGIVSVSPGAMGGFGANHHLRQSLVFLNMPTLQQPEMYIAGVGKLLDDKGELTNEGTKKFFQTFMTAFEKWISTNSTKL